MTLKLFLTAVLLIFVSALTASYIVHLIFLKLIKILKGKK